MHHRDDTEETRTYNEEYYERWGCNEDGAFEYGKYVIFMPKSEHMRYHVIGRHHTDEARAQISAAHKGKKLSAEHRAKVSANNACYWKGKKFSDETRTKMSANNSRKSVKVLYSVYKIMVEC